MSTLMAQQLFLQIWEAQFIELLLQMEVCDEIFKILKWNNEMEEFQILSKNTVIWKFLVIQICVPV